MHVGMNEREIDSTREIHDRWIFTRLEVFLFSYKLSHVNGRCQSNHKFCIKVPIVSVSYIKSF